jgi:HAD superfamily hydrolase (TIGR01509 family)
MQAATGEKNTAGSRHDSLSLRCLKGKLLKLVIFDCDGVLIDSEILADRVVLEYCAEQFPALDFSAWQGRMTGTRTLDILSMMETEYTIRFADNADDIILQRLDERLTYEVQPISGVADALALITYKKAVVSNSYSQHVKRLLGQTDLLKQFDDSIFGADLVARPKPYPDLYLLAAKTMLVGPADCIVIEDSVPGVTAATAAGMKVIGFTGGSHSRPRYTDKLLETGASIVIESMAYLPSTIDKLLRSG